MKKRSIPLLFPELNEAQLNLLRLELERTVDAVLLVSHAVAAQIDLRDELIKRIEALFEVRP